MAMPSLYPPQTSIILLRRWPCLPYTRLKRALFYYVDGHAFPFLQHSISQYSHSISHSLKQPIWVSKIRSSNEVFFNFALHRTRIFRMFIAMTGSNMRENCLLHWFYSAVLPMWQKVWGNTISQGWFLGCFPHYQLTEYLFERNEVPI